MSPSERQRPEQPEAQRVYAAVIFTLSVVASLICTIGLFLAVAFPEHDLLNPHYLFAAIWQGRTPQQVWEAAGAQFPGAHFWLRNLAKADGIVQLGIVVAGASAVFAFLAAAFAFLRGKRRETGWAILALLNAAIIVCAVLGVVQVKG